MLRPRRGATMAVGRPGVSPGNVGESFMGSRAQRMYRELSERKMREGTRPSPTPPRKPVLRETRITSNTCKLCPHISVAGETPALPTKKALSQNAVKSSA